jgi:hypothetical protein
MTGKKQEPAIYRTVNLHEYLSSENNNYKLRCRVKMNCTAKLHAADIVT